MTTRLALGIDIGGSGIKAAMVDVTTGEIVGGRQVIPTPTLASRHGMRAAVRGLAARILAPIELDPAQRADARPWGVAFPGLVKQNTVRSAVNLATELIGATAIELFGPVGPEARVSMGESGAGADTTDADAAVDTLPRCLAMINDADAVGIAEARFGAAADATGSVMVGTLGTGIGTALLSGSSLVANTELGHLQLDGIEVEAMASARAKKVEGLDWSEWGTRLNAVLTEYERLLQPDMFVIGGSISHQLHVFRDSLTVAAEVRAAALGKNAGIVGAALAAGARN